MTDRFNAVVWAEPATWTKPPSAEQIDATGRALPPDTEATEERQRLWFGAVVFDKPPIYHRGAWHVDDLSFTSRQIARAVAEGRKLQEGQ